MSSHTIHRYPAAPSSYFGLITMTSAVALLLLTTGHSAAAEPSLCSSCQSMAELRPLTALYNEISSDVITFQTFVKNLNTLLDNIAELSMLKPHLNSISAKYDDCIRTCSIAFVKRSLSSQRRHQRRQMIQQQQQLQREDAAAQDAAVAQEDSLTNFQRRLRRFGQMP